MIFGVIPAGGKGSRMQNAAVPKQFMDLAGKPVLIHTVEKMLSCSRIDAIYIGVHQDWINHCKMILRQYIRSDKEIHVTKAGEDRNATLMNILDVLLKEKSAGSDDVIVTHDAVRPFVSKKTIDANIDSALAYGACTTACPTTDTLAKSNNAKQIISIPSRDGFYNVQTPQSFKIGLFLNSFSKLSEEERRTLTDACKICVLQGISVRIVLGDSLNFKITTDSDFALAKAYLNYKNQNKE